MFHPKEERGNEIVQLIKLPSLLFNTILGTSTTADPEKPAGFASGTSNLWLMVLTCHQSAQESQCWTLQRELLGLAQMDRSQKAQTDLMCWRAQTGPVLGDTDKSVLGDSNRLVLTSSQLTNSGPIQYYYSHMGQPTRFVGENVIICWL